MKKNLEFSDKYTQEHSERYFHKHKGSLRHRLTTWREVSLARQALKIAGNPQKILDLPCGAGRFWEMLAEDPNRILYGADNSEGMVNTAKTMQRPEVADRFTAFQASAFDIPMEDNSVDHVLCMRLFHHIVESKDRVALLKELSRVAKKGLTISLWVDGNWQANKRMKHRAMKPNKHGYVNRLVIPQKTIEQEFAEAGLKMVKHLDVLPGISMWRYYVLEK